MPFYLPQCSLLIIEHCHSWLAQCTAKEGERHAMITHESPEAMGFLGSASSTTTHRPQH